MRIDVEFSFSCLSYHFDSRPDRFSPFFLSLSVLDFKTSEVLLFP